MRSISVTYSRDSGDASQATFDFTGLSADEALAIVATLGRIKTGTSETFPLYCQIADALEVAGFSSSDWSEISHPIEFSPLDTRDHPLYA